MTQEKLQRGQDLLTQIAGVQASTQVWTAYVPRIESLGVVGLGLTVDDTTALRAAKITYYTNLKATLQSEFDNL